MNGCLGVAIEFEFTTLGQRIFGKGFKVERGAQLRAQGVDPEALKTIADVRKDYVLVDSEEQHQDLLAKSAKQKTFCFKVMTSSSDPRDCQLLGIAFSWQADQGSLR